MKKEIKFTFDCDELVTNSINKAKELDNQDAILTIILSSTAIANYFKKHDKLEFDLTNVCEESAIDETDFDVKLVGMLGALVASYTSKIIREGN